MVLEHNMEYSHQYKKLDLVGETYSESISDYVQTFPSAGLSGLHMLVADILTNLLMSLTFNSIEEFLLTKLLQSCFDLFCRQS